jgi:pimeloyl-ACP methyl ester carboxylesterase
VHEISERPVRIAAGGPLLEGDLTIPEGARGLVLFAHGSGSSRYSPRNRFVAAALREAGLGTLLFDLLTAAEERDDALTGHLRFDISLLADRLAYATDWAAEQPEIVHLRVGYFGASTGAAAALMAAAERPELVAAVVSRGGRPDLAREHLAEVRAPTLLIVGGEDRVVLDLNRRAFEKLRAPKELAVVPGATHLFEERGALEEVTRLAADWFVRYLTSQPEAHLEPKT